MSRRKVTYLPDAIDDLQEIWAFVAEESQSFGMADRLVDAIDDTALLYASNPQIGILRPELVPGIRCFTVGHNVVFLFGSCRRNTSHTDYPWIA